MSSGPSKKSWNKIKYSFVYICRIVHQDEEIEKLNLEKKNKVIPNSRNIENIVNNGFNWQEVDNYDIVEASTMTNRICLGYWEKSG